ncbi:MAG: EAL domain-containing protein [Terracidiphilus sp.]|jgi:sensor c-di-GMP phosphodiesterase-like protein
MRTLRNRVLVARVATITLAACGALAGYQLGCDLALFVAGTSLDQYAKTMAVQDDASSVEARGLLAQLKSSPYSFCSDAEIAYFRELVFRSEYLKDAGRIHGGKIDCSATEGRPASPIGQFRAGPTQKDGAIAYKNLVPLKDASLKRAGLQKGNAYVVFGSHVPASLDSVPMHLIETMKDAPEQQPGAVAPADASSFATDGQFREGDSLFATRCSTLHFNCVTASASVSDALRGEVVYVIGGMASGALVGALLGLVFSLMYRRSRTMEQQLRRAIAHDQLQVAFQPIVNLATKRIVGAETLARWTNEEGAVVSPDVFIKIAEEHGFVGEITKLVVRRALRAFGDTLRARPDFRLSVNASAADLADPTFLPMLDEALKKAKVKSRSLVIEITESSTANREVAMETIRNLRRRGHSIHIDDFGTGYSSLSYLLYLSVDTIKIDQAFTRAIGTESVTVAILPQILAMADSLKLEVVAEGVENERQEGYFSLTGQPIYGQGWLYGRPVSAEEFHGLLAGEWAKEPVPGETLSARPPKRVPLQIVRHRIA